MEKMSIISILVDVTISEQISYNTFVVAKCVLQFPIEMSEKHELKASIPAPNNMNDSSSTDI